MAHDRDHGHVIGLMNDRICASCSRVLSTTSPGGGLMPAFTQDQACGACKPFEELYATIQASDEAFSAVENRRGNYGPRIMAVNKCHAARMAFENFMMQVEAQNGRDAPAAGTTIKRPLTPTSSPQLEVKRLRSTLGNKRGISFDKTVIFRDIEHSRPNDLFRRSSESYAPGRYALSEGAEFLNTGGFNATDTQFFGVKKNGKGGWLVTKEGKELDEQWRSRAEDEGKQVHRNGDEQQREGFQKGQGDDGTPEQQEIMEEPVEKETEEKPLLEEMNAAGDVLCDIPQSRELGRAQWPTESLGELMNVDKTGPTEQRNDLSFKIDTTSKSAQSAIVDDIHLPASTSPSTRNAIEVSNQHPPAKASSEEDVNLYTYGLGYSEKMSPKSRPSGVHWKPGTRDTLTKKELAENRYRGRKKSRYVD